MSELVQVTEATIVNVENGELLPATPENAVTAIKAARRMKDRIQDVVRYATEILAEESRRVGTKTIHRAAGTAVLSGGESIEYDAADLREALTLAGCPEERIDAAITAEISYKVNRSVLKQLASSNQDYKAAIELAERTVEKPYRVSVS